MMIYFHGRILHIIYYYRVGDQKNLFQGAPFDFPLNRLDYLHWSQVVFVAPQTLL